MKVKDLRAARHEDYDCDHRAMELIEGLDCGGEEWREKIAHWLPGGAVEPEDLLKERRARATYEPLLPVIITLTVGAMFAEAPVVEGLKADVWDNLSENCDRARTSWASFFASRTREMVLYRRAWVWLEAPPAVAQEVTEADSMQRLAGVYLRAIDPECVANWTMGDDGRLASVLLEEEVCVQANAAAKREKSIRWTLVDAKAIRSWVWTPTEDKSSPSPEDEVTEQPEIPHSYGFMPISMVEIEEGHSLGWRLLDPCTAHTRAQNELDWALYRAASELLVVTSSDATKTPKVGQGYWLQLYRDQHGADAASYVGPSGTSLQKLADREQSARTAVYRAAQHLQMAADPSSAAASQSAESKARDQEATAILLDSYGDTLRDFMTEVARNIARLTRSNPEAVVVTGLQGKERTDPAALLKAHVMAVELKEASPTARAMMLESEAAAMFPDIDADAMAAIKTEIAEFIAMTPPGTPAVEPAADPTDPIVEPDPGQPPA